MAGSGELVIIGLGRFGRSVATNLARRGQSVLAVDRAAERVELIAEEVDSVAIADATDEAALDELPLERISCAVVTMGSRATEASILTTALLRQMGVPRIVVRSFNDLHARVLLAVGASEVINPEDEMGHRLALHLANPSLGSQIELGDASITELDAPETFAGQSLAELHLRKRHRVTVLALRRGEEVLANPEAGEKIESGDVLVLLGHGDDIQRVAALE
ncbi:MAG: TrkA family potassium uptake protein [Acidobacteriota bacterium]|nr:TrkA family potassium uptake protein [Acidobacteriota bacterium]